MDARGAGQLLDTPGPPPPRTLIAVGLWLGGCSTVGLYLGVGLVSSVALLLASPIGLVCLSIGLFRAHRDASLRRAVRRAGAAPWRARGLWNERATTLAGPIRQRSAPDGADWRDQRLVAGTATLVVLAVVPDYVWRFAVVIAFLVIARFIRPKTCAAARVELQKSPYFTGERATFRVSLAGRAPAEPFDTVQFLLRCVVETPRLRGWARPDARCVVAMPAVAVTRAADGTESHVVAFDVPADAPGTDLLARGPVYWELVVQAASPAWTYEQAFRVPVYAPTSARVTT